MIYSLEGEAASRDLSALLFRIGPVTLSILMPTRELAVVPQGQMITLFISLVWKETGPQLYGFSQSHHVRLFELLQTVSGVGPKLALGMLSYYEPSVLARYLQEEESKALSRIPGVGSKTAQRLIIELKDRLAEFMIAPSAAKPHLNDTINALLQLGYTHVQARHMVEAAGRELLPTATLTEWIAHALRHPA